MVFDRILVYEKVHLIVYQDIHPKVHQENKNEHISSGKTKNINSRSDYKKMMSISLGVLNRRYHTKVFCRAAAFTLFVIFSMCISPTTELETGICIGLCRGRFKTSVSSVLHGIKGGCL